MATIHMPRGGHGRGALKTLREAFWIAALGVLVCFAFFAALGAFDPGEVMWLTALVAGLAVLWLLHAHLATRPGERDQRLVHDRERRGF